MKPLTWLAIPAILLTFIYLFVPAFLWLVDRIFRKPLGSTLFSVSWNIWGILAALLCWLGDRIWIWLR